MFKRTIYLNVSFQKITFSPDYVERLRSFIQPKELMKKNGYILDLIQGEKFLQKKKRNQAKNHGNHSPGSMFKPNQGQKAVKKQNIFQMENMQHGQTFTFLQTPNHRTLDEPRAAVAIDCEMGVNKQGGTEVIRLTAIDYFTSEVLVNNLVYPDKPMGNYRTRFSGVSRSQMERAHAKGKCLHGRKGALNEIWKFVDPSSILVGHSLNNDLLAMQWIHMNVVDTMLIDLLIINREKKLAEEIKAKLHIDNSTNACQSLIPFDSSNIKKCPEKIPKKSPKKNKRKGRDDPTSLSLKNLSSIRLGRKIQKEDSGHDSLEDAFAARDLAHWNVVNRSSGVISNS